MVVLLLPSPAAERKERRRGLLAEMAMGRVSGGYGIFRPVVVDLGRGKGRRESGGATDYMPERINGRGRLVVTRGWLCLAGDEEEEGGRSEREVVRRLLAVEKGERRRGATVVTTAVAGSEGGEVWMLWCFDGEDERMGVWGCDGLVLFSGLLVGRRLHVIVGKREMEEMERGRLPAVERKMKGLAMLLRRRQW
ncbi:hypothetical protein HAX54_038256 [Datura stramonium]|uniref:Uncharacterized protein n=1 Tax=Datura stramonium TaxID=4076 RepID=A0ABS8VL48_DATST|nr:hypothetical protein [Datura stramonium]